jgi:hypothetical protein
MHPRRASPTTLKGENEAKRSQVTNWHSTPLNPLYGNEIAKHKRLQKLASFRKNMFLQTPAVAAWQSRCFRLRAPVTFFF